MSRLPPVELVLEIGLQALLVPGVVTAMSAVLISRYCGAPGRRIAGCVAITLGFLAGNYFRQSVEFRLDGERPLALLELMHAAVTTVTSSDPRVTGIPPARYWLPWCGLLATGVLIRIPRWPVAVHWLARLAVAVIVSRLLVTPALRAELPWLWPMFATAVLINTWTLEKVERETDQRWLSLAIVWMFFSVATVLIHAHSARLTDVATILAGTWIGMAVATCFRLTPRIVSSGLPLAGVSLPGLMLVGQQLTFSEIPSTAFVLLGIAPSVLIPLVFLPLTQLNRRKYQAVAAILILIPTLLAIVLAVRSESLSFE